MYPVPSASSAVWSWSTSRPQLSPELSRFLWSTCPKKINPDSFKIFGNFFETALQLELIMHLIQVNRSCVRLCSRDIADESTSDSFHRGLGKPTKSER